MKTLDKFMLKSYLGPMILAFFIVMFVLMMNFMWRHIDDLVGKGLEMGVIIELMMYATVTLIPMGLPLATLFAAIMTMGNLGENYELLAIKSTGVSLQRIMRPLLVVITFVAISSFFVANNLVPYAYKQMSALLFDINQQKQTIEFKDGLFFNGIPNMSIRVEHQNPESGLLTDVLIYDNRDYSGNMTTTIAESGYIKLTDDKRFLSVKLYNGETFEQTRNYQWFDEAKLRRNYFDYQEMLLPSSGFDFERTDANLFSSGSMSKNIAQLEHGIDSMNTSLLETSVESYRPLINSLFSNNRMITVDSLAAIDTHIIPVNAIDSLHYMSDEDRATVWRTALSHARSTQNSISMDEEMSKETLNSFYSFKVEWHRKMSLPVSIMIFFLIGAPLGAIIRRGGLGMPIVISVIFFVIYYIISITGEKMAKEGTWESYQGMWVSTFILLPIAFFLVYKATRDSSLFNAERYIAMYKKVETWVKARLEKVSKNRVITKVFKKRKK